MQGLADFESYLIPTFFILVTDKQQSISDQKLPVDRLWFRQT
jgi:hypothetical protein